MDINIALFIILVAVLALWSITYFSPRALHYLAAWAIGRASGIEHSARVTTRQRNRFGLTARPVQHPLDAKSFSQEREVPIYK